LKYTRDCSFQCKGYTKGYRGASTYKYINIRYLGINALPTQL
jgi:hypothetical protein